ncbi:MAG: CopG family transcriptional regulator [Acidobacteriota bacterium]
MGQITIYLDDDTEKLVRRHVKISGESTSKWIAEAVRRRVSREWPADVLALFGSWKEDDFPDAGDLRKGYGRDVKREAL